MSILWGIVAGAFLGFGHYFMSRASRTIDFDAGLMPAFVSALQNRYVYGFLIINLCATVSYLLCLRSKQLVDGFMLTTVTMSVSVILISLFVVRSPMTSLQAVGLAMAVTGVVLMNRPG